MLTSGAAAGVAAGPDRRDSGGEAAGLSKEPSGVPADQECLCSPLETNNNNNSGFCLRNEVIERIWLVYEDARCGESGFA